jgi:ABC-type polar amino acid transport system ATPase subunit
MISIRQLTKRFAATEVLRGISMDIAKGQVEAIIGPSGGGKSTFLRCINGLETFHGGSIQVGGLSLTPETDPRRDAQLLRQVRTRVGMVFQQFNLFPHLTVLGNLCEAPVLVSGERRDAAELRALTLLDRVGLRAKKDEWPRNLSGGQMQRVAIARTLMMEPEVILFDEPTSALDPFMAEEVLSVMNDLAKNGQTMIVVTHSMEFARNVADRVHVFAEGLAVESGPPAILFESPRHEVTKTLLRRSYRS